MCVFGWVFLMVETWLKLQLLLLGDASFLIVD